MAQSSAGDRTEKATPKRREEARKEGQVARSAEINSAVALLAGFGVLLFWGPHVFGMLASEFHHTTREAVQFRIGQESVMKIFTHYTILLIKTTGPFLAVMAISAFLANVLQIKFKVTPQAIKPRFSKINPINGFKQKFSPTSLFELVKNILKIIVVGVPAVMVVLAKKDQLLSLGDVSPGDAGKVAAMLIMKIGFTIGGIYIVIAIIDYIWQKHRYEKQLKMTKQEVKQEQRQQDMAPELKMQQRRRQRDMARRRMLTDVPTADVIITNPTHYSIALKYDPEIGAPQVVAKGVDLLAFRIREIAEEAGVMLVENKPLARALYAQVEIGQVIPAELFTTVAEILAFVYRAQNRQRTAIGA